MRKLVLALALALNACIGTETPPEPEAPPEAPEEEVKAPEPEPEATLPNGAHPALLDPTQATETAPDTFKVQFETSEGMVVIDVTRAWAPQGADRFYNMVKIGYLDDVRFFRNVAGFMVQFGIHALPQVNKVWKDATIDDDPADQSNARGYITFATRGKDTRTTQLFINLSDNPGLDKQGFTPFGRLDDASMAVVDALYSEYGEGAPRGRGPRQDLIQKQGNAYLDADFPKMSKLIKATIVE